MNPNGFNPNSFNNIPPFNPNLAYFYQLPLNPLQFQPFVNLQSSLSPFTLQQLQQFNAAQSIFNQQALFMRNTPTMIPQIPFPSQNPPPCLVIDDDSNHSFEPKIEPKYASIRLHSRNESMTTKEEFTATPKIEEKIEEDYRWKSEPSNSDDSSDESTIFKEKLEASEVTSRIFSDRSSHSINLPKDCRGNLKADLKEMIVFIIHHHGQIRETDLAKARMKYASDPTLSKVFETLYSKFSSTFKTRAEIVKYITRKAFSTIKNNSKRKVDSSSKEACEVLCKRYFQTSSEEIQSSGVEIDKRERFLQLLFPYQKNSKNKVQDMELISKLMSSKEFYEDYCLYVKNLDSILEADNNRKIPKFINHIISCIKKNQLDNILKYKRVPWLKTWIENTKSLAKELSYSIQWKSQQAPTKQVKKEKSQKSKASEEN